MFFKEQMKKKKKSLEPTEPRWLKQGLKRPQHSRQEPVKRSSKADRNALRLPSRFGRVTTHDGNVDTYQQIEGTSAQEKQQC